MVLSRIFGFYFVFCIIVVLLTFGLLSFYRRGVIHHLIAVFYLYGSDSNMQKIFDHLKISNYDSQYVKELGYKYSSNYFIKFLDFMSIYYAINLDIVSSCMIFSYLYLGSIDLLQA